MSKATILIFGLMLSALVHCNSEGGAPFYVSEGLYDQSDTSALGLRRVRGAETFTIFRPSAGSDHFSHGAVLTSFKGRLYCMWQSSAEDEDTPDTWTAYSYSSDGGKTWAEPMVLCPSPGGDAYATSGGWHASAEKLIAYINVFTSRNSEGHVLYLSSDDGEHWSAARDLLMADGSRMDAIIEQDIHVLPTGRLLTAAHRTPGMSVCPVYTDDPAGVSGWQYASFNCTQLKKSSRELEPSLYLKRDGSIVMMFRDQSSSYRKLAAVSRDGGKSWTDAVLTDVPDSRSKQSAGNLPDGTAFFVSNPVSCRNRYPLVLTLSDDGTCFDRAFLLRAGDEIPPARYGVKRRPSYSYPKSLVSGGYLYVAYAVNKQDVECVRLTLDNLQKPLPLTP